MVYTNHKIEDFRKIAHLIGEVFYYGHFKAETFAERELAQLLDQVGFLYKDEASILINKQKYGWD